MKSISRKIKREADHEIDTVAQTLRELADNLSDDAESAVAQAAQALRKAARDLAEATPPEVKRVADKAVSEVKAHPMATAAVALSAAAALIKLLGVARRRSS